MTPEVKKVIDTLKHEEIFKDFPFYFIGGTALSYYLNHRLSFDFDVISPEPLPKAHIHATMLAEGASRQRTERETFHRINRGEDPAPYIQTYAKDSVKIEFFHPTDPNRLAILKKAKPEIFEGSGNLKILDVGSIAKIKILALFDRYKTRDLFDAIVILKEKILSPDTLNQLFEIWGGKGNIKTFITEKSNPKDDEALFLKTGHPFYEELNGKADGFVYDFLKNKLVETIGDLEKEIFFMAKDRA